MEFEQVRHRCDAAADGGAGGVGELGIGGDHLAAFAEHYLVGIPIAGGVAGRHPKALSGFAHDHGLIEQALVQLEPGRSGGLVRILDTIG